MNRIVCLPVRMSHVVTKLLGVLALFESFKNTHKEMNWPCITYMAVTSFI